MCSLVGFNHFYYNSLIAIPVFFRLERLKAVKGRRSEKYTHAKYKIVNGKENPVGCTNTY